MSDLTRLLPLLRALVSSMAHTSMCRVIEVDGCDCGAWEAQRAARAEAVAILREADGLAKPDEETS